MVSYGGLVQLVKNDLLKFVKSVCGRTGSLQIFFVKFLCGRRVFLQKILVRQIIFRKEMFFLLESGIEVRRMRGCWERGFERTKKKELSPDFMYVR
ncbi:hypothetical protein B5M47_02430 [candidate division CPR3 bacterium 4484_211]|uniref:Uncharacterized protein n=1 Tax=candidate division CPR3 bacterium 4484_211 TaxID=1968527 RepID=A0A1W9NY02_UNCC3|nr:MAG: hypothetical protein B5M47_02430 [candidate division CPR3 bacterium 4484_211]